MLKNKETHFPPTYQSYDHSRMLYNNSKIEIISHDMMVTGFEAVDILRSQLRF